MEVLTSQMYRDGTLRLTPTNEVEPKHVQTYTGYYDNEKRELVKCDGEFCGVTFK